MENLDRLAARLREPADYFAGRGGEPWCWPRNLIAFARRTRRDLQRRTFESRLHSRYVLVVNLDTAGTLNLDSTSYRLRPGQCHLIFPHQLHTFHDLDREEILWLFLTFELPDDTPLRPLRQATLRVDDRRHALLVDFLLAYRTGKASAHRLQSVLSEILLGLVESAGSAEKQRVPRANTDGKLLESVHRQHARALPDALTVGKLAAHLRLSDSRLRARFRDTFGLSLGEYLRHLRLQEAVAMMRHSQASLTEVALSCGFGSSSAFSRAFAAWAGSNPRAFRRAASPAKASRRRKHKN
jgi:AraC-like DNA-binding protein